jgi:hypothetical protein
LQKEKLERLVLDGLSIRQIGVLEHTSYTSVRYWLKRFGLKTHSGPKGSPKDYQKRRSCKCGETDPDKFYGNKASACRKCHNRYTIKIGMEKRSRSLTYKGGKCIICGFHKYSSSLAFHHVDSSKKDVAFRHMRGWSWERIRQELDKCEILCKNCHSALHAGEIDWDDVGLEKRRLFGV